MSRPVYLHVYDLSGGMARAMSMSLLGKQIDGIWHTGIVVGNIEYYFGGGIQRSPAGQSPFGAPLQRVRLGDTEVSDELLEEFLSDLHPRFNIATYDLLSNNCNCFSEELSQLLVGTSIPAHITGLPAEVMATPFGQMMLPMLQPMLNRQLGNVTASSGIPAATVSEPWQASSAAGSSSQHSASPAVPSASSPPAEPAPVEDAIEAAVTDMAGSSGEALPTQPTLVAPGTGAAAESSARARFEEAVRAEFQKLLAEGVAHNQAGVEALRRALLVAQLT